MLSNLLKAALLRRAGLVSACMALVAVTQLVGAGSVPAKNLKLDPWADKVELFAGMEDGSLSTRMIPADIHGGNIFIQNKSDKPLTVILPEAIVGVHVLKQFGGGFGGGQQGGFGGQQGGFGGQGGQQGGQSQGGGFGGGQQGGFGGGQQGGFGGGGGGQGFFSIPPNKTAQVPYNAVCLNYGKADPMPRMTYRPVPLEQYTDDKVLQETLKIYGTGRLNYTVAQAATWHLTDKLSVNDLANIKKYRIPGDVTSQERVFSDEVLRSADQILTIAKTRAAEREKSEPTKPVPVKPRTTTTETAQVKAGK